MPKKLRVNFTPPQLAVLEAAAAAAGLSLSDYIRNVLGAGVPGFSEATPVGRQGVRANPGARRANGTSR